MLVIRVELHSAITHKVTEIARMRLWNTGTGTKFRGDYKAETYRGRTAEGLDKATVSRKGEVTDHRRTQLHVWVLVRKMLQAMGY